MARWSVLVLMLLLAGGASAHVAGTCSRLVGEHGLLTEMADMPYDTAASANAYTDSIRAAASEARRLYALEGCEETLGGMNE